jgi:hypothetical protein
MHKIQDESTPGDAIFESGRESPNTNQESKFIAKTIHASLWRRMQKTLYDPLAARQLKYFNFGGEEVAKDMMLEEEYCGRPCKSALAEEDSSFVSLEEVEVLSFDDLESYNLRDESVEKVEANDVKGPRYLDEFDGINFSALEGQDDNYGFIM